MPTPRNLNTLLGINLSPENVEEDEPCRECGEDASEDDRPMKDDALCWDCYRDIYEEEED